MSCCQDPDGACCEKHPFNFGDFTMHMPPDEYPVVKQPGLESYDLVIDLVVEIL